MKKPLVILLHIAYWAVFFIAIMIVLAFYFRNAVDMEAKFAEAIPLVFLFALLPSISAFYAFYFFIFPKYLVQKKYLKAGLYGGLIALVIGTITYFLLAYFVGEECFEEDGEDGTIGIIIFMAMEAFASGTIALIIKGFLTWFEEIKLKENLKQKNQEMELALIKSQLDPHFLFNTINNIDVLILKDQQRASTYLNKLSDIMRFTLYETKVDLIPLVTELEYIEKYIELQKIRSSNEHFVEFEVVGKPEGKQIAPMIFIPFVENCFKHSNNKKLDKAISIFIEINEDHVIFNCKNKFDAHRKIDLGREGLGNKLISKRLHLIYPDRHDLSIDQDESSYGVKLTIRNA